MSKLVLIGVGNLAIAVNDQAVANGYDTIYGTTRQSEKIDSLRAIGIEPILLEDPLSSKTSSSESLNYLKASCNHAHVVASFPPNGSDDQILSDVAYTADKIVYISSTGVYGGTSGVIDEDSDVEFDNPYIKPRLDAERTWRSAGAIVLRAPALYGPTYGLHLSIKAGKYKIVGDGSRFSSRIHLADLASIVFAALARAQPDTLYLVGDDKPTSHLEVVSWLCKRLSIELPQTIPVEKAHVTQRANRQVNAARIKSELGVVLNYPTYVEGFEHCLQNID